MICPTALPYEYDALVYHPASAKYVAVSSFTLWSVDIDCSIAAYVSIQRIEVFLEEPEVELWVSGLRPDEYVTDNSGRVAIVGASFKYQDSTTQAPKAQVVAIEVDTAAVLETLDVPVLVETENGEHAEETFELRDIDVEFPIGKLSLVWYGVLSLCRFIDLCV